MRLVLFDPQNNVYHLPRPATAFDFACQLQPDACRLIKGVRINGREIQRFYDQLLDGLRAEPDAETAGLTQSLPALGSGGMVVAIEGNEYVDRSDYPFTRASVATPRFFSAADSSAASMPSGRVHDCMACAMSSGVGTYITRTRSVASSRVRSTVSGSPARNVTVRVRVIVV